MQRDDFHGCSMMAALFAASGVNAPGGKRLSDAGHIAAVLCGLRAMWWPRAVSGGCTDNVLERIQ